MSYGYPQPVQQPIYVQQPQPMYVQQPQPMIMTQQMGPMIINQGPAQNIPSVFGQTDSVMVTCPSCKAHAQTTILIAFLLIFYNWILSYTVLKA